MIVVANNARCSIIFKFLLVLSTFHWKLCNYLWFTLRANIKNKKYKIQIYNYIFFVKNVFKCIINIMCFDKVLTQFNIFLFFIIKINVFDFNWNVVFYQVNFDDVIRFVAFENKKFNSIEQNYVTHERELLIIKNLLKNDVITSRMTRQLSYESITQTCNILNLSSIFQKNWFVNWLSLKNTI